MIMWVKIAGKSKINSKSNKTNKATIIKNEDLSRTLDFKLSNPDSNTVNWGSLIKELEDSKNWTQVSKIIIRVTATTIIIITI